MPTTNTYTIPQTLIELLQKDMGSVVAPLIEEMTLKRKSVRFAKKEEPQLEFGTIINPGHVVITLPLRTESEAQGLLSKTRFYKNGKAKPEHWTEARERHQKQKKAVYFAFFPIREKMQIPFPCIVKLTRYASRELDADDNLRIALKWVKDYVASMLTDDFVPGRADGDKRIKWEYDQVKTKNKIYGVKIEIIYLPTPGNDRQYNIEALYGP